jgi:ADP-ribose pyrophosphatase
MTKIAKWKLLSEKDISPSPYFPLFVHKVELPNGKIIDNYYVSKLGHVAMIVAVTDKKEIFFVRQYKHGVNEIILELPAGRIEKRPPEEAAKAELQEETGIIAEKVEPLGEVYVAPSKDSTITYGFLVRNARVSTTQNFDEHENIELALIPAREIDQKIKSSEIKAADTIALLNLTRLKFPEIFSPEFQDDK